MIVFLKRHRISLSLLILSTIVGFAVYMKVSPLDIWRVEYEFKTSEETKIQDFAQTDTVFQYNKIFCRNYTGSIADTLVENGIRRYELKVFLKPPSNKKVIQLADELLASEHVTVVNHRYRETQRDKRAILYWALFGFFLGMVAEFILALIKKPSSN